MFHQTYEPSTTLIPNQWPIKSPTTFTYSYPKLSDADITRIVTKMIEVLESRGIRIVATRPEEV